MARGTGKKTIQKIHTELEELQSFATFMMVDCRFHLNLKHKDTSLCGKPKVNELNIYPHDYDKLRCKTCIEEAHKLGILGDTVFKRLKKSAFED